ncbi:MAG: sulfatase-like hydrolase/transferase, partial [Bacteroidota bacterium]
RSSIPLAPFQQKSENGPQLAYKGPKLGEIAAYSDIQEERPIKEDKQRELIHGYMASVSYVDAQIGLLLDKLEELGIADNTIICLWGDHGFHLGDHGLWTKHTNFEQAVRSPMIISSPAGFTPSKTNAPVEFVDIFPTLCSLADLDIPKYLPGKNLVPIMKGSSKSVRHSAMAQYTRGPSRMGYTLRSERYRYVKWIEMKYYEGEMKGSLITNELYDYEKDPLETINLADDPKYRRIIAEFEREFKSRNVAQTRSK